MRHGYVYNNKEPRRPMCDRHLESFYCYCRCSFPCESSDNLLSTFCEGHVDLSANCNVVEIFFK